MLNFTANTIRDPSVNAEFDIGDRVAGLSPSVAQIVTLEVGSFSSPGRRSPTRVLPGVQQANVKFSIHGPCRLLHPRQVPGRLRCQARRATQPATATTVETPARVNPGRTDTPRCSLSRPAGGAFDLDLPHHHTRAGSRHDLTHDPTYAWRTTGGRTTSSARGAERRGRTHDPAPPPAPAWPYEVRCGAQRNTGT